MFYDSKIPANIPGEIAKGDPASLGEVFESSWRDQKANSELLSRARLEEEEYDRRIDAMKAAGIGVDDLPNPYRSGPRRARESDVPMWQRAEAPEPTPIDPHAEFEAGLKRLAQKYPKQLDVIQPDRSPRRDAEERALKARREASEIYERGPSGAFLASLAGGVGASFTDPVNLATMAIGPMGSTGVGARAMLSMAAKSGAANMGVEAVIQPEIRAWNQQSGVGYTAADAAMNLGSAFLFGFGLDLGVRSAYRGVMRYRGNVPQLDASGGVARWLPPGSTPIDPNAPAPVMPGVPKISPDLMAKAAQGDAEAQARIIEQFKLPPEVATKIGEAAAGDTRAIRDLAEQAGMLDDPAFKGALDRFELEGGMGAVDDLTKALAEFGLRNPDMDRHQELQRMMQAVRSMVDPNEPPPVIRRLDRADANRLLDLSDEAELPANIVGANQSAGRFDIGGRPAQVKEIDLKTASIAREMRGLDERIDRLEGQWDQAQSGRMIAFEPVKGPLQIVDGRARASLAQRVEGEARAQAVVLRQADGWTRGEAEAFAVAKNLREGKGGLLEAAQAYRDRPELRDLIEGEGDFDSIAKNLADLSDAAFEKVRSGEYDPAMAAMVAEHVADPGLHAGVLDDLARMGVRDLDEARRLIPDLVPPQGVAEATATLLGVRRDPETAEMPLRAGAEVDDPAGAAAKAQVERLAAELAPEIAEAQKLAQAAAKAADEVADLRREVAEAATPEEALAKSLELRDAEGRAAVASGEITEAQRVAMAAIQRRQDIEKALADAGGIVPQGVTVKTFASLSELPPEIQADALRGQADAFLEAHEAASTARTPKALARAIDAMERAQRGEAGEGFFTEDGTIWVATYAVDPKGVLSHEVVHALKAMGQITDAELALLAREAKASGAFGPQMEAIYRRYLKDNKDRDARLMEEAAAHLIQARKEGRVVSPEASGIIDRIRAFLERLGNSLRGYGFKTADDVIEAVLSGEMAKRQVAKAVMREEDVTAFAIAYRGQPDGMDLLNYGRAFDHIGLHFGTLEQARAFSGLDYGQSGRVAKFDIDDATTFHVKNDAVSYSSEPMNMAGYLIEQADELKLSPAELAELARIAEPFEQARRGERIRLPSEDEDKANGAVIRDMLGARGIKTLSYDNRSAEGFGRSYIVMVPDAARMMDSALPSIRSDGLDMSPEARKQDTMFAFAGETARTADRQKLAIAQDMESRGATRDAIWKETGWFRGVDKKWRFEITDKYDIEGTTAKDMRETGARFRGGKVSMLKMLARNEIDDATLYELMQHEDLFAAYPDLLTVTMMRDAQYPRGASYGQNVIEMGSEWLDRASNPQTVEDIQQPMSTTMHEVTHAIQDMERMNQGGAPGQVYVYAGENVGRIQGLIDELQKQLEAVPYASPEYEAIKRQIYDWKPKLESTAAYEGYRRLAGEVEARTVERRLNMTADERRARPPWEDYDVPESDQIVRFPRKPGQAMMSVRDVDDVQAMMKAQAEQGVELPGGAKVNGVLLFSIRAFHGSPHDFERFDIGRIGTGEGAQAYGHGLYFAEREGVAKSYRDALSATKFESPSDLSPEASTYVKRLHDAYNGELDKTDLVRSVEQEMGKYGPDWQNEAPWLGEITDAVVAGRFKFNENPGRLYEVRIDAEPEDFLDWDKPLSQQSEKVRKAVADRLYGKPTETGADVARAFEDSQRSMGYGDAREQMAERLRNAGIPGIRYLDQGSRGAGEGSRNYVVFDDSLIEIVAKDGQPVQRVMPSIRSDLDMSPEARKQRAEAMGFDTSKVWYHGTAEGPFDEFSLDPVRAKGEPDEALFFSNAPGVASEYAGRYEGSRVLPVYTRLQNPKRVEMPDWGDRGETADIINQAKAEGHDAVIITYTDPRHTARHGRQLQELAVFNPTAVRSVNADFDPAQSASPQLMASIRSVEPETPDLPSLVARIMDAARPYLDAANTLQSVERDDDGNIIAMVRGGRRYMVRRDGAGNIAGISEAPRSLEVARDGSGRLSGLIDPAAQAIADQQDNALSAIARIVADQTGADETKAKGYAREALDIAREAGDNPQAAIVRVGELIQKISDDMTKEPPQQAANDNLIPTPLMRDMQEMARIEEAGTLVSACRI